MLYLKGSVLLIQRKRYQINNTVQIATGTSRSLRNNKDEVRLLAIQYQNKQQKGQVQQEGTTTWKLALEGTDTIASTRNKKK